MYALRRDFVCTDPYIDAGNGSGWIGEDIFQKPERGSAFKTTHFQRMNIRLPLKRAKYVIPSGGIFADPVFGKTIFKGRGRHHMFAPRLNLWITPKCRKATQRSNTDHQSNNANPSCSGLRFPRDQRATNQSKSNSAILKNLKMKLHFRRINTVSRPAALDTPR